MQVADTIRGLSLPTIPNDNPLHGLPGVGDVVDVLARNLAPVAAGAVARQLDDLGALAGHAKDNVLGWAGQVRDQLAALPSGAANALADSMRGGSARTLTGSETAVLRQAFGNRIDLSNVRIVDGPGRNPDAWLAFNVGGNPAITEGNTVYLRHDHNSADLSKSSEGINTLVHEFTHVRQFQTMGFGSFFAKYAGDLANTGGDRGKLYDYATRHSTFGTETIEGQAAMVGDLAGYRAGQVKLTPAQAQDVERRLNGTGIFGR